MGPPPLLDTTTLSDVLRGREPTIRRFRGALEVSPPCISVLTWYEIERGLRKLGADAQRRAFHRLVGELRVFPVDGAIAAHAADLWVELQRLGRPIGEVDTLIAATARFHGLPVVARDRDFAQVPGLSVTRWDV